MDIAALAMVMSQTQVRQDASIAVLKMAIEGPKEQMADVMAALQAMEASVSPHVGGNIDLWV
ncbi:MAG: putative motility protein [Syntrophomonadaceae bacterium]|nr:putative motility protein [Syntrophomonadaceae bacterium]